MASSTSGLNIVVCGSGNGAQTAAGYLAAEGHHVWLYFSPRYAARATTLQAAIDANGGAILLDTHAAAGAATAMRAGYICGVSTDAAALIPRADIVIISVTGPAMDGLAKELAPHLRRSQLLLYLQGLGCVNFLQLRRALDKAGRRPMPMVAASRTLPWACRVLSPAHVNVCGTKATVGLVLPPGASALEVAMLSHMLHGLFPETTFDPNPNPVEASFLPFDIFGNAVLHPGIMYGSWEHWDGEKFAEKPQFYHGVNDAAVEAVQGLESEAAAVIAALSAAIGLAEPPHIPDVRSDLEAFYGSAIGDPSTLGSLLRTNAAYESVYHPMVRSPSGAGWVPDFGARLLSEDVPSGLVPIKGAAQILGVPTPWTDRVIEWAQRRLGREYLVDGKLEGADVNTTDAPQAFGVRTPSQLIIRLDRLRSASFSGRLHSGSFAAGAAAGGGGGATAGGADGAEGSGSNGASPFAAFANIGFRSNGSVTFKRTPSTRCVIARRVSTMKRNATGASMPPVQEVVSGKQAAAAPTAAAAADTRAAAVAPTCAAQMQALRLHGSESLQVALGSF